MNVSDEPHMPRYRPGAVDALGPPPQFQSEERYVGYRAEDYRKPYAHFFKPRAAPIQAHVTTALRSGPAPTHDVIALADLASALAKPGHLALESGFGVASDGHMCVACLTDMPGVAPSMWRWWFGWHLHESARYKLWHPEAHVFTAPGAQRSEDARYTSEQKYIGNISWIDEYIGSRLMRLAVRFVEPSLLGFASAHSARSTRSAEDPDEVIIVARGGPSLAPVTAVWLIHHVRRTSTGSQMRSRFYIGPPVPLDPLAVRGAHNGADAPPPEPEPRDLLLHCATEMNHLALFLPALHREFGSG